MGTHDGRSELLGVFPREIDEQIWEQETVPVQVLCPWGLKSSTCLLLAYKNAYFRR